MTHQLDSPVIPKLKKLNTGDIIACPVTDEDLLIITDDGLEVITDDSLGQCYDCERWHHVSALVRTGDRVAWQIVYEGAICQECLSAPARRSRGETWK